MKSLLATLVALTALLALISPSHSLDTRLFYSADDARLFFEGLLPIDVFNYFRSECIDLAFYIPVYSLILWLGLQRLYPERPWYRLSLGTAILDVYETGNILLFLSLDKPLPPYLGVITLLKWISAFIFTALIFYGLYNQLKKS